MGAGVPALPARAPRWEQGPRREGCAPPEPLLPNQLAFNMTMAVTVPSSRGRPGEDIKHPQAPPNGVSACGRRPGLGVRARP